MEHFRYEPLSPALAGIRMDCALDTLPPEIARIGMERTLDTLPEPGMMTPPRRGGRAQTPPPVRAFLPDGFSQYRLGRIVIARINFEEFLEPTRDKIPVCRTNVPIQAEECCICMQETNNVRTQCGHEFCVGCITQLIGDDEQNGCPICRAEITRIGFDRDEVMNATLETYADVYTA